MPHGGIGRKRKRKKKKRTLPSSNTTTAVPQRKRRLLNIRRAKPVQEIRLPGNHIIVKVRIAQLPDVQRILPPVQPARVEPGVGPAHTNSVRGAVGVRVLVVAEVNVVGAEVGAPKGRVGGHGEARGSGAGERGVERGTDGEDAGVGVVREADVVVGRVEEDLDFVLGVAGRGVARGGVGDAVAGGVGHAQQGEGTGAGYVELFYVDARRDEDRLGCCVVGEGGDGVLDGCEVCVFGGL